MGSIRKNNVSRTRANAPTSGRVFGLAVRATALALVAAALSLPAAGARAQQGSDAPPPSTPLEQVQALVQPAVVYEQISWTGYAYDETNDQYFTKEPFKASFQCTGFVVNPNGYVATAGHCVDFGTQVAANFADKIAQWAYDNQYYLAKPSKATILTFAKNWRIDGQSKKGTPDLSVSVAYGVSVSGEPSGKAVQARVVGSRPPNEGDVALLKIDAEKLTVVPLSDNKDTGVGTQVVSVGYPLSVDLVTDQTFDPSFKEGSISAKKTTKGGLFPVYEISAAVSGGMSGGPTTSLNGNVVGVNSFGIAGETQSFNFVQASQTLQELMRDEGVDNSLGEVTDLYRSGLRAYFAGDRDAAIAAFTKTLEIVPNHEFAQEYRRKAQELPESTKVLGLPVLLAVGIVAAVIIVVIVLVVLFVVRRRKRIPTGAPPPVSAPVPDAATGWQPGVPTGAAVPPAGVTSYPPPPTTAPVVEAPAPPPTQPATARVIETPPPSTVPVVEAPPPPSAAEPVAEAPPPPPTQPATARVIETPPPSTVPVVEAPPPPVPQPPPPGAGPRVVETPPPAPPPTAATAATPTKKYCPNCGEPHAVDAHFCESCGFRLAE